MDGRRQKRFEQLDLQLQAIADALAVAQEDPDPDSRAEKLLIVERAFTAFHREHRAVLERPALRLLQGGGLVAAMTGAGL